MAVNTLTNNKTPAAVYEVLSQTRRQRVSDGADTALIINANKQLVLVWPQLGDFDSLEYAWWLRRGAKQLAQKGVVVRAVGIGDLNSGKAFCDYTGFPEESLLLDPDGTLHQELGLYPGLTLSVPGFNQRQNAWVEPIADVCWNWQPRHLIGSIAWLSGRSQRPPADCGR